MSHVAKIDIKITDLDALEKAAADCGLELVRGQKTYKWYGRWVDDYSANDAAYKHGIKPADYGSCDHAIRIPGNSMAYEVGVVKNPNGEGWVLIWDFWNGGHGLQAKLGGAKDCFKLQDAYSKHVAIKQADALGYVWEEEVDEDGEITINMYDYS